MLPDVTAGSVSAATYESARTGPATLASVIAELDDEARQGQVDRLRPLATGFDPLDDILNGGIRPSELLLIGGAFGVGKTIWGLQVARNVVRSDPSARAMYVCYEHDRTHLMMRLLCLESAEQGLRDDALTLRKLSQMALEERNGGLVARLAKMPRYAALVEAVSRYQDRLVLAKASGDHTTLATIRDWIAEVYVGDARRVLVVVDYLQKIPVRYEQLQPESEITTVLTQGLKELAMTHEVAIIAIAASDRPGLKSKRMVLADLRGSSALQYEADIGLILNNKHDIVSREHMVYNINQAEAMRNWVVMTVEKNRAGRHAVDMEYMLDAAHFRIVPTGGFVRERLVDQKVILD